MGSRHLTNHDPEEDFHPRENDRQAHGEQEAKQELAFEETDGRVPASAKDAANLDEETLHPGEGPPRTGFS